MRRFSSSTIASSGISAGEVSVKVSETNGVDYKLTISCNVYKEDNKLVTNELSLEIGITVKPTDLLHGLPNSDLVKVTAGAALVLAIAMIAAFVSGGAIMAGAGAAEKCVDLEISDWKEMAKKKEEAKKIDSALSKQARDLRAQLAAQGFEVTIRTSKSKKEAKKQAHFKQILILQSDSDPKKVSQGRALFNKLSDKDKQAYLEYRKNHAND